MSGAGAPRTCHQVRWLLRRLRGRARAVRDPGRVLARHRGGPWQLGRPRNLDQLV